MRLRLERDITSILQYQLPVETILTRLISRLALAPDRWSKNKHQGASPSPNLTFFRENKAYLAFDGLLGFHLNNEEKNSD